MKTRERIKRLKAFNSIEELLLLAKDKLPGTKLDFERLRLIGYLDAIKAARARKLINDPRDKLYSHGMRLTGSNLCTYETLSLQVFGENMVQAIADGNSDFFREWAAAIEAHKNHKPGGKDLRREIIVFWWDNWLKYMRDGLEKQEIYNHLKTAGYLIEKSQIKAIDRILKDVLKAQLSGGIVRPPDTNKKKASR